MKQQKIKSPLHNFLRNGLNSLRSDGELVKGSNACRDSSGMARGSISRGSTSSAGNTRGPDGNNNGAVRNTLARDHNNIPETQKKRKRAALQPQRHLERKTQSRELLQGQTVFFSSKDLSLEGFC